MTAPDATPRGHHPWFLGTRFQGPRATCSCGWKSETYRTMDKALLAFNRHQVGTDL